MCQPLTCGEQLLRAIALRAKVPLAWIVQPYRGDALQLQDDDPITNVGRFARCLDVLMVSDGRVACLECQTEFRVPWIGEPPERVAELRMESHRWRISLQLRASGPSRR